MNQDKTPPRPVFPRKSTPMPNLPLRPEQSTREGLEALADVVSVQANDGLTLEEQVRKLQRELLAVQAEQTEIRRLIGTASAKDEEHETRLVRLEAESARISAELAATLSRVETAVAGVQSGVQTVEDKTAQLAKLVEGALKAFSWRWVLIALCWCLGGAAATAIQNYLRAAAVPASPVLAPVGGTPALPTLRVG